MRSVGRRRAWLAVFCAALVVLAGTPAMASTRDVHHAQPFQPVDTTSYAVAHGGSVLPGLLVWMASLAAVLVVGIGVRWFQRVRS